MVRRDVDVGRAVDDQCWHGDLLQLERLDLGEPGEVVLDPLVAVPIVGDDIRHREHNIELTIVVHHFGDEAAQLPP